MSPNATKVKDLGVLGACAKQLQERRRKISVTFFMRFGKILPKVICLDWFEVSPVLRN
jgi:hypothetical protein